MRRIEAEELKSLNILCRDDVINREPQGKNTIEQYARPAQASIGDRTCQQVGYLGPRAVSHACWMNRVRPISMRQININALVRLPLKPTVKNMSRNFRKQRRRPLSLQPLETRRLLAVSPMEQETVYLINRARHNPVAYQQENSLPVSLSGVPARPPLAVNSDLFDATETKVNGMVANNYFAHASPAGVHPNGLARSAGYPLPDFYPDNTNFIESLAAGSDRDTAIAALNALIIDEGLPTAPHRNQLLGISDFNAANREIGVGFASHQEATFGNYWSIHTARRADESQFLTGVVYEDLNGDDRYNAGEGLSGVTITIDNSQSTQTNAAGGWSFMVQPGEHHVVARGGSFNGVTTASTTVTTDNVAIDFVSGEYQSYVSFEQKFSTNAVTPQDVSGDTNLTPFDALLVLNYLSLVANNNPVPAYDAPVFLDSSKDGGVSPFDALVVINELSIRARAQSEQVSATDFQSDFLSSANNGEAREDEAPQMQLV